MQSEIRELLQKALEVFREESGADFPLPEIQVEYPKDEQFGDYTTNLAMVLARVVKQNPLEIARSISGKIKADFLESVDVVPPGYINFSLSKKYYYSLVERIILERERYGSWEQKSERVMLEYSQPNTHKEFHIGHLRNVMLGSSMVNTLRKAGYPTIAANYIGDTGTHIAKCLWGLDKFHAGENIDALPDKTEFLGKIYSEAVQAITNNPEYEEEFKVLQKKFEAGDERLVALWQKTRQWSLDDFARIYQLLDVEFDAYFFESEEEIAGKKLLPELKVRGIAKESQGAIIADLEAYNLGILVLVRNDGSALYGLKDIPLAINKFEKHQIDTSIVITDVRQSFYFQQLFKILELYGFQKNMRHIGFEVVSLKGGESMSSRKGNMVPARKFINDVTERVRDKFPNTPALEAIALGAIRFYMLKYSSISKIEFDIEEALKMEGATGPYVQYAHARICNISKKASDAGMDMGGSIDYSLLIHEKEILLIRELHKFPELVAEISQDYAVHKLPFYAIRLADKFHSFYDSCRVVDLQNTELSKARLALSEAVKTVLAETLRLIGVAAPEKM